MAFTYKEVVPWGRSFDEYVRMFDLSGTDLTKKILGCGDGPASFNVQCNRRGGDVTSVDPIYAFTRGEIEQRIRETYQTVLSQTRQNMEKFQWDRIRSVEELGAVRMAAMQEFLESYEAGLRKQRYRPGALPELPFADGIFEISLSSHFLFLYSENLSLSFHVAAIKEMLRVSRQVRIFPLLDVNASPSPYLDKILELYKDYRIAIKTVDYEFQIGGNQMLLIESR